MDKPPRGGIFHLKIRRPSVAAGGPVFAAPMASDVRGWENAHADSGENGGLIWIPCKVVRLSLFDSMKESKRADEMKLVVLMALGVFFILKAQATSMERPDGEKSPRSPILAALDKDRDDVISAAEIAAASSSLLVLDENGDGRLGADEIRPAPPGMGGPPPAGGAGPGKTGMQPPKMPIASTLDADGDGAIDAKEIANAPVALLQLDKNGDGRLAMDEIMPPRPGQGSRGPGASNNGE
jgi:hypothetical protein